MDSAELLDLLGNENRRRILRLLSRRPCYVTEIGEFLDVSPKAVIDHLRKLEEAGLVESRTDGSRRKYFHIARDVRLEVNVSRHGFGTKSAYPANPGMDLTGRCRHVRLELDGLDEPAGNGASESVNGAGESVESTGETADSASESVNGAAESVGSAGEAVADGTAQPADGRAGQPADDGTAQPAGGPSRSEARATNGGGTRAADVASLASEYDRLRELENELSLAQRWVRGRLSAVLDDLAGRLETESDARLFADVLAAVADADGSTAAIARQVDASRPEVESALRQLAEIDVLRRTEHGWEFA